jgi:PAT family beta-lactamase induction signal transducer AmpG
VLLSQAVSPDQPLSMVTIGALVTAAGLAHAFGFIALPLYVMQQLAAGDYEMSHYAFAMAFATLLGVVPQALGGLLADVLGYRTFFLLALVASVPSVIAAWKAPFPVTRPESQPAAPRSGA